MPLFTRILLWFFFTIFVLAGALYLLFTLFFQFPSKEITHSLTGGAFYRICNLAQTELNESRRYHWDTILSQYGKKYGVRFYLVGMGGRVFAGSEGEAPLAMREKVAALIERRKSVDKQLQKRHEGGLDALKHGRPVAGGYPQNKPPPVPVHFDGLENVAFSVRSPSHPKYWMAKAVRVVSAGTGQPMRMFLVAGSDSITGRGVFFDAKPWLVIVGGLILLSGLMWLPLARSLSNKIKRIMKVAERIGQGDLEARLDSPSNKTDELNRLSIAIDEMADRLNGYVLGQKRFLGDIAHELGSPLARLQMGLMVLLQHVDTEHKRRVDDIIEDVEALSDLVNEILSFSRAEIKPEGLQLKPVNLLEQAKRAYAREKIEKANIEMNIDEEIFVLGDGELIVRALSNLIRNAIRYASDRGAIQILAETKQEEVVLRVQDHGDGVKEETLVHLFEPFYRPKQARDRESGGVGLGLAIVKTCVDAMGGRIFAENLKPKGFAVSIVLQKAPDEMRA